MLFQEIGAGKSRESAMNFFDIFEEEQPKNKRLALDPLWKKALTDELVKKQKGRCMYCGRRVGRDLFDLDHKNPVARGGTNRKSNFQLLCRTCNTRKGAMTDREFRRKYKPIGVPQTQVLPSRTIPQSKFVDVGKVTATRGTRATSTKKRSTSRTSVLHAQDIFSGGAVCGRRGKTAGIFETVTCRSCQNAY